MKKTIKKIITASIISLVTLAIGFALTMTTFNLFDYLSIGEMRVLFAIDVISLLSAGGGFLLFQESKAEKKRREEQSKIRRTRRIEAADKELSEINRIINQSNFAA